MRYGVWPVEADISLVANSTWSLTGKWRQTPSEPKQHSSTRCRKNAETRHWTLVPYLIAAECGNSQRVGTTRVNNHQRHNHTYMKHIKLIALIAGATILAGAPALILPRILRAPRPRRSRPNSMRKNGKIPNSKNSLTAFRRPHAVPA
jgi:hypothetical protein